MDNLQRTPAERIAGGLGLLIVCLLAAVQLMPLYWMLTGSLKVLTDTIEIPPDWFPTTITWDNYKQLLLDNPTLRWLWNSLFMALAATLGTLVTSSLAGYAFGKKSFPGKNLLFWTMLITMMLPNQVMLIPLYLLIAKLGWVNTYAGLIMPFIAYPFGVFLMKQFMQSIPSELLDAAKMDGAGELRIFSSIVVPIALPAIGSIGIFAFVAVWNEYLWQLVVIDRDIMLTLPVAIAKLAKGVASLNLGLAMAGATVAFIPMLIFFLAFQRFFIKGVMVGSLKG
ncbi:carbohydrate ABC transporter permease [Paenibacillus sp. IB182496]|uniref:Carbohydrate ABC transporter permease n=1 Tax=Paenibacillus sabuli TaxID=2772509 RepID=A0A927GTE1_9BACL|nr:carbohydrate ABC transporter permease [Paenibacillus sabuli]MBD2846632.1 carbohydrate ABC transporter permease [Paenibacillus sabuli]